MNKKQIGTAIATLALALTFGGGLAAANAATTSTSMSDWTQGTVGSWRTNTGSSQYINPSGCRWSAAAEPTGHSVGQVQMQLQKDNGAIPASLGNKQQACGTNLNWGGQVAGRYRYQLNGWTDGTNGSWHGLGALFSASSVTISY